jgi:hypothetical protein
MPLGDVLVGRFGAENVWLQTGVMSSPVHVVIDNVTIPNPPVLAHADNGTNAAPVYAAGQAVLVAKLATGIIVLGKIKPQLGVYPT